MVQASRTHGSTPESGMKREMRVRLPLASDPMKNSGGSIPEFEDDRWPSRSRKTYGKTYKKTRPHVHYHLGHPLRLPDGNLRTRSGPA